MKGRYFCLTMVVRVNQIEVAPGVNLGEDERRENTYENFVRYRQAVARAIPEAKITIAFSHEALKDQSENFVAIRNKAKEYHERYGDDVTYLLGAYFCGVYSPRKEICTHVDEALELLQVFMGKGYLPLAIVGGFVPAKVMEHVASKGIRTIQGVIFSQYSIDNQDGDGSPCYPYYPSKEHFCKPAQSEQDKIDIVTLDGWTVDFVNATYPGVSSEGYNSRMGCGPIETIRPFGKEQGLQIMLASAAQMLEESYQLNGGFGYATAIWELCLVHKNGYHHMGVCEEAIEEFLVKLKGRFSNVQVVPFGTVGEIFRETHKTNSFDYRFCHRGIGVGGSDENVQIEWFMNRLFRLGLRTDLQTGERRVIDFTNYTKRAQEPPDCDYKKGVVCRNWSLLGDVNQKGVRPQDKPLKVEELTAEQKALIRKAENEYGFKVL
ncbi:MAG: DUF3863 domain-containing protein [Clostridia bacterium]|nr:DUF3863 domain-containing protein [Clostridia bacterium]